MSGPGICILGLLDGSRALWSLRRRDKPQRVFLSAPDLLEHGSSIVHLCFCKKHDVVRQDRLTGARRLSPSLPRRSGQSCWWDSD